MTYPRYTPLIENLPSSVPFVGPESQERERNFLFEARVTVDAKSSAFPLASLDIVLAVCRGN